MVFDYILKRGNIVLYGILLQYEVVSGYISVIVYSALYCELQFEGNKRITCQILFKAFTFPRQRIVLYSGIYFVMACFEKLKCLYQELQAHLNNDVGLGLLIRVVAFGPLLEKIFANLNVALEHWSSSTAPNTHGKLVKGMGIS